MSMSTSIQLLEHLDLLLMASFKHSIFTPSIQTFRPFALKNLTRFLALLSLELKDVIGMLKKGLVLAPF